MIYTITDYDQDRDIVIKWLRLNQPNVRLEDIYRLSTACLILNKSNVCVTAEYAKNNIFPNLGKHTR